MALENLVGPDIYIDNLVRTNPAIDDPVSQGDDHLRGIKNSLLNSFPNITGPVTATQDQINAAASAPMGTALANVTGSRALATNYTNSGIKVMTVIVSGNTFVTSGSVTAIVDGITVAIAPWSLTDGNYPYSITFLVPPGKVYRVNGPAGVSSWAEYS